MLRYTQTSKRVYAVGKQKSCEKLRVNNVIAVAVRYRLQLVPKHAEFEMFDPQFHFTMNVSGS